MLEVSRSIIYTRGWGVSRWLSGIEVYLFPSVTAAEGREPWLGGSHWVPCLIDTLGGEKGHEKERNEIRTGQGWSLVPVRAKGRFPFLCTLVGQPVSSPVLTTRAGSCNSRRRRPDYHTAHKNWDCPMTQHFTVQWEHYFSPCL